MSVADAHFRSFQNGCCELLPARSRRSNESLGDGRAIKKKRTGVESALQYAMSLPVCTTVSGIDSMKVLRQNLRIARGFSAMTEQERETYERTVAHDALDGRYELYKTTAEHDGEEGREQHGFPSGDSGGIAARSYADTWLDAARRVLSRPFPPPRRQSTCHVDASGACAGAPNWHPRWCGRGGRKTNSGHPRGWLAPSTQ